MAEITREPRSASAEFCNAIAGPLVSIALAALFGIDVVCDRVDCVDPLVQALLPEPERRSRLHREADALLGTPTLRPCGVAVWLSTGKEGHLQMRNGVI